VKIAKGEKAMKFTKHIYFFVLVLICLSFSACGNKQVDIQESGSTIVKDLALSDFDQIEVSHMFDVDINQGDTVQVIIEVEESLEPYLDIATQGSTLKIGLKPDNQYNLENTSHQVYVTMPDLTRVKITNFCDVIIHDFYDLADVEIEVSGLGSMVAEMEANAVRLDISDQSSVKLAGNIQEITGKVEGLSSLDLSQVNAQVINVDSDQLSEVNE
jgi:hypothetical protein